MSTLLFYIQLMQTVIRDCFLISYFVLHLRKLVWNNMKARTLSFKSFLVTKAAFDQKYSKNSNIVKYYYNLKLLFSILM